MRRQRGNLSSCLDIRGELWVLTDVLLRSCCCDRGLLASALILVPLCVAAGLIVASPPRIVAFVLEVVRTRASSSPTIKLVSYWSTPNRFQPAVT